MNSNAKPEKALRGRQGPKVGSPKGNEHKSSILDVAKRAQVAVGTVSRVINQHPSVRDETRRRVLAAIVELNYAPDIVAQAMRSNRSMTMGCVMRDFTVPVLSMFVDSMQQEIDPFGFSLIVASSYHDPKRERALLAKFQQRRLDGLAITTSSESDATLIEMLDHVGYPLVLIDRQHPSHLDAVCVNHAPATQQAVEYLFDIGHRSIALVSGESDVHPTRSRVEGYLAGLRSRGLAHVPELIRLASFGGDAGHIETQRVLRRTPRTTAIIAGGTALLPGVIRAIRERGLSIPGDVSVIGGADSDVAQLSTPPFTVVRWSHDQLGKAAGRFLMERLLQPALLPQRLTVEAELVLRGSCSSPTT